MLLRKELLQIYINALESVKGDSCVINYLESLEFKKKFISTDKIAVLALGKASVEMAYGAYSVLNKNIFTGLVVTKEGHLTDSKLIDKFNYIESSHPIPTSKSIAAAESVIHFIKGLPKSTHLIVLISGGTSALVEKTKPEVSLEMLIQANEWLLSSGLAIEEINTIRSALSGIKGGQILSITDKLKVTNLLLSDVLSNKPEFIGSGMFVASAAQSEISTSIPQWLKLLLDKCHQNSMLNSLNVDTKIIASNILLLNELSKKFKARDSCSVHMQAPLSKSIDHEADIIANTMLTGNSGVYIWGGEPTVDFSGLTTNVGKGGRNQHLALLIADKLKSIGNIMVLCIGTDGTDGNTDDAGALIDGQTITRGIDEGYSATNCLSQYDSGSFLQASGDIIYTGATGTNVMDVVIAYKW